MSKTISELLIELANIRAGRKVDKKLEGEELSRALTALEMSLCEEKEAEAFICPIGGTLIKDPVIASDGQSYDRAMITPCLAKSTPDKSGRVLSPWTRNFISTSVIPNDTLRVRIEIFLQKKIEEAKAEQTAKEEKEEQDRKNTEEKANKIVALASQLRSKGIPYPEFSYVLKQWSIQLNTSMPKEAVALANLLRNLFASTPENASYITAEDKYVYISEQNGIIDRLIEALERQLASIKSPQPQSFLGGIFTSHQKRSSQLASLKAPMPRPAIDPSLPSTSLSAAAALNVTTQPQLAQGDEPSRRDEVIKKSQLLLDLIYRYKPRQYENYLSSLFGENDPLSLCKMGTKTGVVKLANWSVQFDFTNSTPDFVSSFVAEINNLCNDNYNGQNQNYYCYFKRDQDNMLGHQHQVYVDGENGHLDQLIKKLQEKLLHCNAAFASSSSASASGDNTAERKIMKTKIMVLYDLIKQLRPRLGNPSFEIINPNDQIDFSSLTSFKIIFQTSSKGATIIEQLFHDYIHAQESRGRFAPYNNLTLGFSVCAEEIDGLIGHLQLLLLPPHILSRLSSRDNEEVIAVESVAPVASSSSASSHSSPAVITQLVSLLCKQFDNISMKVRIDRSVICLQIDEKNEEATSDTPIVTQLAIQLDAYCKNDYHCTVDGQHIHIWEPGHIERLISELLKREEREEGCQTSTKNMRF